MRDTFEDTGLHPASRMNGRIPSGSGVSIDLRRNGSKMWRMNLGMFWSPTQGPNWACNPWSTHWKTSKYIWRKRPEPGNLISNTPRHFSPPQAGPGANSDLSSGTSDSRHLRKLAKFANRLVGATGGSASAAGRLGSATWADHLQRLWADASSDRTHGPRPAHESTPQEPCLSG